METKFKEGDIVRFKTFPPIAKNNWSGGLIYLFNGKENKFTVKSTGTYRFGYEHDRCITFKEVNCWHPEDEFELYEESKSLISQFEVGKWYKCSCNSNLYQFDGYLENKKFGSSAVINILDRYYADANPGYTKRTNHSSCIEYFSPSSLADMEIVNKFLPEEKETIVKPDPEPIRVYNYEVVHCETYEQWKFVHTKQNSSQSLNNWDRYKENIGFCLKSSKSCPDSHCGIEWFKKNNSKIYSFDEWCKLNGYSTEEEWIPQVGDWVVIISGESPESKQLAGQCVKLKSKVGPFTNGWTTEGSDLGGVWYDDSKYKDEFRKALFHEIPAPSLSVSKEEKKDSIFIDDKPSVEEITCETCNGSGRVIVPKLYPSGHHEVGEDCPDCKGNGFIDKPKESINTYGLKVGDLLPSEVLDAWFDHSENYLFRTTWKKMMTTVAGNREIVRFEKKEGVDAFLISNTGDVWARCEGFLEFKNSFGKPKSLTMQEIQEECKKKYPIGCTYIPTHCGTSEVLKSDKVTYTIHDNQIYAHDNGGCLYSHNGKWAKLISVPATNQKDSFVLPEKWCIKLVSKEINNAVNSIKLWKNGELVWYERDDYRNHYITNDGEYDSRIDPRYTEITFDQFKEYVLNKSVKKTAQELRIEEAKKEYPIGSSFYDLVNNTPFTVASHNFDTFGNPNQLYVPVERHPYLSNKTARLYKDGVWAQKVSHIYDQALPRIEKAGKSIGQPMILGTGGNWSADEAMFYPHEFSWTVHVPKYSLITSEEENELLNTSLIKPLNYSNVALKEEKQSEYLKLN